MGFFRRKVKESTSEKIGFGTGFKSLFSKSEPLANSSFWACINNLAKQYATLPLHAQERDGAGVWQSLPADHYLNNLINHPNPYMTRYHFFYLMGLNFDMHGMATALIVRSRKTGLVKELWPISPAALIASIGSDGQLRYTVGMTGTTYLAKDVLVIYNTPDSYASVLSPSEYAKTDLELEAKCKKMQEDYYEGGSVVGRLVSVPKDFNDKQKDMLRAVFDSAVGFKNFVLDERVKVTPLQVAAGDVGKLIEANNWTSKEVAKRFGVPPFFIGDTSVAFASAEQQGLQMVIYCLGPRLKAWEDALNACLCFNGQRYKFSMQGLLRGDHAARSAFYHQLISDGVFSPNEVRALEDMPPYEGGDTHFFPMNFGSVQNVAAGAYANNGLPATAWNEPAEEPEEEPAKEKENVERLPLSEAEQLEERKRRDRRFIEAVSAAPISARRKLEKMIRENLKAEIERLLDAKIAGSPFGTAKEEFLEWYQTRVKSLVSEYSDLYVSVMKKMLPSVKDGCGIDRDVDETKIEAFALEYAKMYLDRHAALTLKQAAAVYDQEDFAEKMDAYKRAEAINESENEANRTSNAFTVFFFGQLGVTEMHAAARSDACSFCHAVDGKVCSVSGYILKKGDEQSDEDGVVTRIEKNFKHPPFHDHCSCHMVPGK